jgi:hypothetical protein
LPTTELAELSLGDRDASLLALHEHLFGDRLPCVTNCPHCGERVEFDLSTRNLRATASAPESAEIIHAERTLQVRALNSRDLAAAVGASSVGEARALLARRCVLDPDGIDFSNELIQLLAARLAEIDRRAEILLDLVCPACEGQWQQALDVEGYVWREIAAEALRLLRQVDTLARAYGWREADILGLSPTRRQAYVELAG